MKTIKLTQEHFDQLKSGIHACPSNIKLSVSSIYKIINPSNPKEEIKAKCTQNYPYALLKIN